MIFQSKGTLNKLRMSPTKVIRDNPIPSLMRFLSRKFPEFLTKLVAVNPKQKVHTKKNTIDRYAMPKTKSFIFKSFLFKSSQINKKRNGLFRRYLP